MSKNLREDTYKLQSTETNDVRGQFETFQDRHCPYRDQTSLTRFDYVFFGF